MTERPKQIDRRTVALGNVVEQVTNRVDPNDTGIDRYVAGQHMEPDELRIRRWGTVGDGYLGPAFHMRFKPGQTLYGSRRTYLRKVAVADFEGVTANTTFVLQPRDTGALHPELLPFILQSERFLDHSIRESRGSVNPYVNFSDLAWFEFPLPAMPEQLRLVKMLRSVELHLQTIGEILGSSVRLAASLLEHALDSGSSSVVPLGTLLTESPRNGCSAQPTSTPTGHWVLALSAITPSGYRAGELKPVSPSEAMRDAILQPGDLVVSRSNTSDLVGLPVTFPEDRSDVSYPDTMMRLRVDRAAVMPQFLEGCLRTRRVRQEVRSYAAGTSSSMKKINAANLKKVQVPLIPLHQQEAVVDDLRALNTVAAEAHERLRSARALKAKLLDVGLYGEGELP